MIFAIPLVKATGIGLFLLGVVSLFGLATRRTPHLQKLIMSWGIGASFGGTIALLILSGWEKEYVNFVRLIFEPLQLRRILPNFPVEHVALIGTLISALILGGFLVWHVFDRLSRKDDVSLGDQPKQE